MKLSLKKRAGALKSEIKAIRREGNIPAVLYGSGHAPEKITVSGVEFEAVLRQLKLKNSQLATTVFELHIDGAKKKALVKDIQYHPATYAIEHLDFIVLEEGKPVTVNVPIQILGAGECAGVKLGGTLRQVIRALKVMCLPAHIPAEFQIDVRDLGVSQSKRLSDIAMPSHVRPLSLMNEVAVVVAKAKGAA